MEELFHLFSLSTVCLANLSYSPQATLGLPTTPYKMKNWKLFCRGKITSQIASLSAVLGTLPKLKLKKNVIKCNKNQPEKVENFEQFVGTSH